LKSFANYINQNSQLFNKIEFKYVSDKDIFNAVLMNTKFDHIAIKQYKTLLGTSYSIVKRQSSLQARLLSPSNNQFGYSIVKQQGSLLVRLSSVFNKKSD
jgi:hypothetical protein